MKEVESKPRLRWRLRRFFKSLQSFFLRPTETSKIDKDNPEFYPRGGNELAINGYFIRISDREAMLLNHLLTLHSYSPEYLEYLMKPGPLQVRNRVGQIILQGAGYLQLLEEEMKWLLVILPVTFPLGRSDAGFSLKKKLYEAYLKTKT